MKLLRVLIPLLVLLGSLAPAFAGELSVFAASSLTEALQEAARTYQFRHPETQISLNFAGSQTLAAQIERGAPADLLIAADPEVMTRLQHAGMVESPRRLLRNRLALAVRSDHQPPLQTLADLGRPGLLLVIGNPQVPVGRYTRQLLAGLDYDPDYGPVLVQALEKNIVSEENRVKAIVAKLLLGEADAGFVYQSDLSAATRDRLSVIPLPDRYNPEASYPLAKLHGAGPAADDFGAFLFSPAAQAIFARHGFLPGAAP
jgi:molybdate transport system substrate-binding protein